MKKRIRNGQYEFPKAEWSQVSEDGKCVKVLWYLCHMCQCMQVLCCVPADGKSVQVLSDVCQKCQKMISVRRCSAVCHMIVSEISVSEDGKCGALLCVRDVSVRKR